MRNLFIIVSLLFIINGCSQNSNPLTTSVAIKSRKLLFTLSVSKTTYAVNDTLKAIMSVYNYGTIANTVVVGGGQFDWSLQDGNGQIIMSGGIPDNLLRILTINPGQTEQIYRINEKITGMSGKAVNPGTYDLNASLRQGPTFMLRLSIQ